MTRALALAVLVVAAAAPPARATTAQPERYALIVSGATGGDKYAENYDRWRAAIVATLRDQMGFEADRLIMLSEKPGDSERTASAEEVRRAVASLASRLRDGDLLLVVLIGHGTFDGVDAKFNLVGPDLEAAEWRALVERLPGRLVFVNTAGASFPFLERLAGPNRVVVTSTDSAAQVYETIFPEFFTQGLGDPEADLDKNGRISMWEVFVFASARVRAWYEQRGQLSTERPVLDDTADGIGKEAGAPGPDGALAHRIYFDREPAPDDASDPALVELRQKRAALESEVEQLKLRKPLMPPSDYETELERLLIELARVSREIRRRS